MNSTMRKLFATILTALTISTAKTEAGTDEEAIRTCFREYQAAIANKDGKAAASLVSKPTLSYFAGILNNALNADEAKVRRLDFYRKMMVLLVRQDLSDTYKASGYSTNASHFFALIIERGWVGQVGAGNLELGKITMDVDVIASAPGILNGQATPAKFVFERTAGGWKFSLLDVILRVNKLTAEKQKNALVNEDDAILQSLEARTSRLIKKDIWKPIWAR